jgi:hypothetical protein
MCDRGDNYEYKIRSIRYLSQNTIFFIRNQMEVAHKLVIMDHVVEKVPQLMMILVFVLHIVQLFLTFLILFLLIV